MFLGCHEALSRLVASLQFLHRSNPPLCTYVASILQPKSSLCALLHQPFTLSSDASLEKQAALKGRIVKHPFRQLETRFFFFFLNLKTRFVFTVGICDMKAGRLSSGVWMEAQRRSLLREGPPPAALLWEALGTIGEGGGGSAGLKTACGHMCWPYMQPGTL